MLETGDGLVVSVPSGFPVSLLELWNLLPPQHRGDRDPSGARGFFLVFLGEQGSDGGLHLAAEFCAVSPHLLSPAIICGLSNLRQIETDISLHAEIALIHRDQELTVTNRPLSLNSPQFVAGEPATLVQTTHQALNLEQRQR